MGEPPVCLLSQSPQNEPDMTGWVFKWTNYLKGYQRRWFVLQNGLLSYYRAEYTGGISTLSIRRRRRFRNNGNQAEMAHTCRGSISLHGALIHTVDACSFVISNGGTQTFHIRAGSEVERQCWVTKLELSKAKAIRNMESEEDEEEAEAGSGSPEEWSNVIRELQCRLDDLRTCSDLIAKHGAALQRALSELETSGADADVAQNKSKTVSERATLFRIASNAMMNACSEYLGMAQAQGCKWTRLLQHERDQRQRLEEMVETLAQQHSKLEQAAAANAQRPNVGVTSEEDEDTTEFYDALAEVPHGSNTTLHGNTATSHSSENSNQIPGETGCGGPSGGGSGSSQSGVGGDTFTLNISTGGARRRSSDSSSETDDNLDNTTRQVVVVTGQRHNNAMFRADGKAGTGSGYNGSGNKGSNGKAHKDNYSGLVKQRRTVVPSKPHYPLNLWSIMKNCIGKDLSKIPMPVNFSEPLSMLQRLAEDFEYADILDNAAKCTDPFEQLAYVAAFTISSYSTTNSRTGKPFNPLLGETYELDRTDDFGWRLISEQVSHHPPMVAQHCDGNNWTCWQEFTMTSKFRGKYLQVIPLGTAHVEFKDGNKYSWRKVTTTVHNIIVGKLWVDQHGDMEIICRGGKSAGIKCHLKYIPYSYFSKESQRRVKGAVMDASGIVRWIINGKWDRSVEISQVHSAQGSSDNPIYETGPSVVAWECHTVRPDSDKYYNFTTLACQLNEMEEGVAPTDSRNRPDQRLMENREWDNANKEKVRLEEKQRAARRWRECEAEHAAREGRPYPPYEPVWFKQIKDPETDNIVHVYKGEYWEHKKNSDFAKCPDIF